MRRLLTESKYAIHERLYATCTTRPDPEAALARFHTLARQARRVSATRAGLYLTLYASVVAAALASLFPRRGLFLGVDAALNLVAGASSSLGVVAALGILVASRWLGGADVELSYRIRESLVKPSLGPA